MAARRNSNQPILQSFENKKKNVANSRMVEKGPAVTVSRVEAKPQGSGAASVRRPSAAATVNSSGVGPTPLVESEAGVRKRGAEHLLQLSQLNRQASSSKSKPGGETSFEQEIIEPKRCVCHSVLSHSMFYEVFLKVTVTNTAAGA